MPDGLVVFAGVFAHFQAAFKQVLVGAHQLVFELNFKGEHARLGDGFGLVDVFTFGFTHFAHTQFGGIAKSADPGFSIGFKKLERELASGDEWAFEHKIQIEIIRGPGRGVVFGLFLGIGPDAVVVVGIEN